MALLEADVALPVVKTFIERGEAEGAGRRGHRQPLARPGFRRHPAQGAGRARWAASARRFELRAQPPVVVLLAGLQGAGKTTTAGKLARWLIESHKKRVLLVSTDVRRPAAILQLQRLAEQVGAGFFPTDGKQKPADIARDALGCGAQGRLRRADRRHRGPPARRCRAHGRGEAKSSAPWKPTSGCSSSTPWPARTR